MRFLLLLVAAVVAIFAGVAALQLASPPKTETPTQSGDANAPTNVLTTDVLVARVALPAGTLITEAMVDKQPWPENLVLQGFIAGNGREADVIGKVTRAAFQVREPLISTKLADKGDSGFLAASLPEGMRAITISTDAVTGVAGFVFPGDRIDLLFTHNIPENGSQGGGAPPSAGGSLFGIPGLEMPSTGGGGGEAGYAEVLASNIPVLAINIRDEGREADSSFIPSTEAIATAVISGTGGSTTPSSLTLQVTDIQAEKIRLAERAGSLSVALRSVKDRESEAVPPPADLASLTQVPVSSSVQPQILQSNDVKVIRGAANSQSGTTAGAASFGLLNQGAR